MQTARFIVWDLGATKCAAAVVTYTKPVFEVTAQCYYPLRQFDSLHALAQAIEQQLNISMTEIDAICIGGAGQYNGQELILNKGGPEGYPYAMPFAALARQHHWPSFTVVHDYTPIVCSTFINELTTENIYIYPGVTQPYGRRIAFGIGTGLGMKDALLLPNNHIWLGTNEIGHIGLTQPPKCSKTHFEQHHDLIQFMRHQHYQGEPIPITFESILSGPGLVYLYQFTEQLAHPLTPEETAQALVNQQRPAAFQLFARYLGLFIGTIQLAFMPSGGIWMTGGLLQRYAHLFSEPWWQQELQHGLAALPAYQSERQQFALTLIEKQHHVFLGGAFFALKQLQNQIHTQQ